MALFVRIVAAHPFLVSGQTKVDGPQIGATIFGQELSYTLPTSIRDATFTLFAEEYKVPLLSPQIAAYLSTAMETACCPSCSFSACLPDSPRSAFWR